jgi:phospholipid/cholesterol/gamma-HCH transport system substrate-binding protein
MKFIIRFADQVVGLLIIAALGVLVLAVIMLGSRHRWFAKDYLYVTYLESASGLSPNMAVQFKGFTIGNVKSFDLTGDNRVKVGFSVYDTYRSRVREGSAVELAVSPLGLGSHFYFHPGRGDRQLEEGELIPAAGSPEARSLQDRGLADIPKQDDSVTLLISRASVLLEDVDRTVILLREALGGSSASSLGRIVLELEKIAGETERAVHDTGETIGALPQVTEEILAILRRDLEPALGNIRTVTAALAAPDKLLMSALDGEGFVAVNLESSLASISGILHSLDKTTAMLPPDMAQVAGLLEELRAALKAASDVLVALTNNPLLKKGVPPAVNPRSTGTSPRDIPF